MALTKFEVDVANVSKLDDEPNIIGGMSAEELKAVFDKAGVDIKAFLNGGLLLELERLGVEQLVQHGSDDVKYIRVNADKVLEVSADGYVWTATGSSGHLVLDKNGVELPQRSRMQFVNSEVKDEDGVTRVYGIKGDTGPQGERGEKGETGSVGPIGKTGPSIVPSVDANGVMSFSVQDTAIAPQSVNVRGPQGPQGVQGLQGLTGATGPQGVQGVAGPQGPKGEKGDTGATGATGAQGIQGVQGARGPQGEKGATGATGPAGPAGPQGPTGAQGPRGDDGADGKSFVIQDIYPTLGALKSAFPYGNEYAYQVTSENDEIFIWSEFANDWASLGALQGPMGPQGATGPQGPTGATGATGATGPEGPQGIQGVQGEQGPVGPQGPKGDKGDTGEQGPQGIQGERGPQGATGAQGVQGVAGKDAYVGAQENGYAGSESQFYSDLAKITTTVTTATNAQSAANAAQTTANEAKSAAAAAQRTADSAATMDEVNAAIAASAGIPIAIAESSDGVNYTATVSGIDTLSAGQLIVFLPSTTSAATLTYLNINGIGNRRIHRGLSSMPSDGVLGPSNDWLKANKPQLLMYVGVEWVVVGHDKPVASDLHGTVPVNNGGTGVTSLDKLAEAMGMAKVETGSYVGTGTGGTANPTTLTFGFEPKFVVVANEGYYAFFIKNHNAGLCVGSTKPDYGNSSTYSWYIGLSKGGVTWSGNKVSWYADITYTPELSQLNGAGKTYNYIAIG